MAILFIFLCISVTSLVRCDDNVAMESGTSYQETYKVYPDPEDSGHQEYSSIKGNNGGGNNQFHISVQKYLDEHQGYTQGDQKHYEYQYVQQHESLPENEGQTTLAEVHGVEEVHPISHNNVHQQHQTYQHMHHHRRPYQPTRVKGKNTSQASQVKHINEKEGHHKALGFSSYIEHVSDKEEEEAAIKEGSVGDIKRLVPKSGISFKIYHNDKQTGSQKTHQSSHSSYHVYSGHGKEEETSHNSNQHQNLKVEVPVPPVASHDYGDAKGSQYYLKDQSIDHEIENIHPNIGVVGSHGEHEYQSENLKESYYTQIEGSSHKSTFDIGGKSSVLSEVKSGNHETKPTSSVEFNKNLNLFGGHKSKTKEGYRKDITKFQYKKPHYISNNRGKTQFSLRKPLKHLSVTVKPTEAYHFDSELHKEEKITQSHVQNSESGSTKEGLSSYISHTTGSPHVSVEEAHGVHFSHPTTSPHGSVHGSHPALITHSTLKPLIDIESNKEEHSSYTSHLSSSHEGLEGLKNSHVYIDHTKLSGEEESKGDLHGYVTHSTVSPHTSFHETNSHSTASPIEFEAAKSGHSSFHTQLSSNSHEGIEHAQNYDSHLSHSSHTAEEEKSEQQSFVSHSASLHHGGLDFLKTGQVSYHTTASPLIDFKSPKEGLSSYATPSPHEELSSGGKSSVPSSHISFGLGKDSYHTVISHTTAAPHISFGGNKESHFSVQSHSAAVSHGSLDSGKEGFVSHASSKPFTSFESAKGEFLTHTTAVPHVSSESEKGGYITHTTPKPLVSFESGKGGYVTHSTAIPHVSFESDKGGYITHTTPKPLASFESLKEGYFTHSTAIPHVSLESNKGEYITHSTTKPLASFESIKEGYIAHSTAVPHVSLEADKGGYITHTTPKPVASFESIKSGYIGHSTVTPHVSLETDKGGYIPHTTPKSLASFESVKQGFIAHTTPKPVVSFDSLKSGYITHSTAIPHVKIELDKGGYISHTTLKPFASFESNKGGYVTHTTALPQVTLEPAKVGYFSHTTAAPLISFESNKGGFISHTTASPLLSLKGFKEHGNLLSHSEGSSHVTTSHDLSHSTVSPLVSFKGGHDNIISHSTAAPHVSLDLSKLNQHHEVAHSFSEIEIPKLTQSHFVKHLTTNTYLDAGAIKGSEHTIVSHAPVVEVDSAGKGHGLTHVPINTYIDAESTKTGQKNFDHQKALEGSTSFDFKNAIGSAEPLTHQVQITPAQVEHLGKQTLTYIVPKMPVISTPVPIIDNHIHETVIEKQPTKHFGYGSLLPKYPAVTLPDLSGKHLSSPQTILWTSEHLKHGKALTHTEFHQPLVNLHLPKQELLKHTKLKQVEIPTSYISHQPVIHQKAPLVIKHETPVLKYTQDLHYSKRIPQVQPGQHIQHIQTNAAKLLPVTNIDWSLYKTMAPNFKMNMALLKPEILSYMHEPGKKIIPILVKKRKNRSSKDVEGIIYGKTTGNRGPVKPHHRNDKAVRGSMQQDGNRVLSKGNDKNEFSVSASYKVDRSLQTAAK